MGLELNIILAYALGLILLYMVGSILLIPFKVIIKLVWNGIVGGIILLLVNILAGLWGMSIVINPFNALVAGFLGVPGVILLIILQMIL